jgi:hypothetical protein
LIPAASLDLALLILTLISVLIVNPNFIEFISSNQSLARQLAALTLSISAMLVLAIILLLFYFERLGKSARILSGEFADEMGWHSDYSNTAKPRRKATRVSSRVVSKVSSRVVSKYDTIRARTILREIAENSYLPLVQSDIGPTVYAGLALLLFFSQVAISYVTFLSSK